MLQEEAPLTSPDCPGVKRSTTVVQALAVSWPAWLRAPRTDLCWPYPSVTGCLAYRRGSQEGSPRAAVQREMRGPTIVLLTPPDTRFTPTCRHLLSRSKVLGSACLESR